MATATSGRQSAFSPLPARPGGRYRQHSVREGHQQQTVQLSLQLDSRSPHVKWGYDLFRRAMNTVQMGSPSGSFSFTGQFTQNPAHAAGTGAGLADTLLGLDASASLSVWQETGTRRWEHGLYIQDDYRITNKLTLNLGVR